jgi:2-methylcitrate dehydratase PrpD
MHVLNDLIKEHQFKAEDIDKIIAKMPDKELEIVNNRPMPDISVQHLLAVMSIDKKLTFKSAHDFHRMTDPKVLKIKSKVIAIGDESLTDVQRRWRCVMEVHLKNGTILHGQTMAAKGSFENPLSLEEEKEKAMDLIAPIIGKNKSLELFNVLCNIENVKNVQILRNFYTK